MNNSNKIKQPKKKHKLWIRLLIILGLLSIINFFYWYLKPELIQNKLLFWLLTSVLIFDSLRIVFLWYHYWNITIPEKSELKKAFSVDVLTTYFPGEPYDMIKTTLKAIKNMNYPHTTYLCDEANDQHLKSFCEEHDIVHVTRNNRINAKAGNINNTLEKHAKGDICLILDPDHVPFDNFLEETLPYFQDEDIGFVQSVQAYYNYDESKVALGAAQQTFHFYGPVMMCMNNYGTVNAIGANCIFRRKALDSIGGHAPGLSEDMHTAMQLHAKGWKSIYVPKVLTRGLTPASLTAYYKQQLKWSRGTLDLLTTVVPKLFKNFNWKQKLHYGLLPIHYLSGIFFLIGFLIPILSLLCASLPWKGNIINFGLIYFPVFASLAGIHLYVQKWLLHKSERGLHVLGGVLMICTWWIYLLGFIYTVIGKKIPYLPTPKESSDVTNFKLLLPNLTVAALSIFSIIYGLYTDFTPFTIVMACFAAMNAFFMLYTLRFGYEKPKTENAVLANYDKPYLKTFKNSAFKMLNKSVVAIVAVIFIVCTAFQYHDEYVKWIGVTQEDRGKNIISYLGTFTPKYDNGLTDLHEVKKSIQFKGDKFDLISLYLAWNKEIEANFPDQLMDSIYSQKSFPLITWEPWLNTFKEEINSSDKNLYNLIEIGYFDAYISEYADKLKSYNKPVFLRFAHEFDNPFYPWYIKEKNDCVAFKKAWVHTYEIFKNVGANNVIWIWNPWKAENVESFYPGKDYVDWIGVNILNYGNLNTNGEDYSFRELYKPFHDEFKKLPNTPVIVSEFGSLKNNDTNKKQKNWIENAFKVIENEFSEIKSVVYFNSKIDNNLPEGEHEKKRLDWSVASKRTKLNLYNDKKVPDYVHNSLKKSKSIGYNKQVNSKKVDSFIGVNFKKGHNWNKDYHVLTRKNLESDFNKLSELGLNTINYLGNPVYDYNFLKISKEKNINISYCFWIPENIDFVLDTSQSTKLKNEILDKIASLKENDQIFRWQIKNDVLYNQEDFFHKPELLYQNEAYVLWLNDLLQKIKEIDPKRSIVLDVEINKQTIFHIKYILEQIKDKPVFGLIDNYNDELENVIEFLNTTNIPFILSEVDIDTVLEYKIDQRKIPFFINRWQDKQESNDLNFKGLIDRKGRIKTDFLKLQGLQHKKEYVQNDFYNILKPAKLLYVGQENNFHTMVNDKSGWRPASTLTFNDLKFEWSLIKCDEYGNYLALKEIGNEAKLTLKIPESYDFYRLHLSVIKNNEVVASIVTKLNTPFN